MIGYSVAPAPKRRLCDEARKFCNLPIVELHRKSGPELMPPAYFHQAQAPTVLWTPVSSAQICVITVISGKNLVLTLNQMPKHRAGNSLAAVTFK